MFDKYWYRQREFQYIDGIQEEQLFQFSNTTQDVEEIEEDENGDQSNSPTVVKEYDQNNESLEKRKEQERQRDSEKRKKEAEDLNQ